MFYDTDGTPIFHDISDAETVLNDDTFRPRDREAAEQAIDVMEVWDAEDLLAEPVLYSGQAANCHYESVFRSIRLWLSRTTTADGEPFEHKITIEHQVNGSWRCVARYDGGDIEEPMSVEGDAEEERNAAARRYADGHIGKFVLEIEPGNEAMQNGGDVGAALESAAERIRQGAPTAWNGEGSIIDRNGNTVGRWTFDDFNS